MTRDSARSTPGLLQRVDVEPGVSYTLEITLIADGGCNAWVGGGDKRQLAAAPASPAKNATQILKVKFRAPNEGRAVVGVLFSSGSPPGHSVILLSALLRRDTLSLPELPVGRRYGSPVVAGMASIPGREATLDLAIDSLINQVDHIFVYLNNHDEVPRTLLSREKVSVFRSQDHGDLRDNGKFFALQYLAQDVFFFSVDDDIIYPQDYVWRLVSALKSYGLGAAVGVHGVIYPRFPATFFSRSVVHFQQSLDQDLAVSVLGTGTTAFHTSVVNPKLADFGDGGIADLRLGSFLKDNCVPAIAVARPEKWLLDASITVEGATSDTLYVEAKQTRNPGAFLAASSPWGFEVIDQALEGYQEKLHPASRKIVQYGLAVERGLEDNFVIEDGFAEVLILAHQLKWTPLLRHVVLSRLKSYFGGPAV